MKIATNMKPRVSSATTGERSSAGSEKLPSEIDDFSKVQSARSRRNKLLLDFRVDERKPDIFAIDNDARIRELGPWQKPSFQEGALDVDAFNYEWELKQKLDWIKSSPSEIKSSDSKRAQPLSRSVYSS